MEKDERWEVNSKGELVVGTPTTLTPSERRAMIEKLFSINGWNYTLTEEITSCHYLINLKNKNLGIEKQYHLYHGNIRKEDPERNREEKKIQLGTENDPRQNLSNALILGFYVYENKQALNDTVIVAWPIEEGKNYPANPSLRVNMRTDIQVAKNIGYYIDNITGKRIVAFRPEFIYQYLKSYKDIHYSNQSQVQTSEDETQSLEVNRKSTGTNILLYGVPGSGKSWTIENEYCNQDTVVSRLVFHPDYTNADFIGQILPVVDSEKQVTYEFTPGPFTTIIKNSYNNPEKEFVLIIEEINRGNAPAIFGEVFQLLDRTFEPKTSEGETYPKGTSEYGITHKNMALHIYGDETHKVRIPSNLSIIGTMNTSDQNVFTLDTAFQRRWQMRLIENNFDNVRVELAEAKILDTGVTWKKFCEIINGLIISSKSKMVSAEDKRLGVYFIHENDIVGKSIESPSKGFITLKDEYNALLKNQRAGNISNADIDRIKTIRKSIMDMSIFPQKVIKYLWDDAFKFNPEALFNMEGEGKLESLEQVIQTFVYSQGHDRFKIFKQSVRDSL